MSTCVEFESRALSASGPCEQFHSVVRAGPGHLLQVCGRGSDTGLCGDLVIANEDARIGTPCSRMWGAYLSGMWLYRLGLTRAKECALTGRPLSGREAA